MKALVWAIITVAVLVTQSWAGTYLVMHPPGAKFDTPEYDRIDVLGESVHVGTITMDYNGISYVIGVTDDSKVNFLPKPYDKQLPNGGYPEGYMLFKK